MESDRRSSLAELLSSGVLSEGERLELRHKGRVFNAMVTADGQIKLDDGRVFPSPSGAAVAAIDGKNVNGWAAWRVPTRGNVTIGSLRGD